MERRKILPNKEERKAFKWVPSGFLFQMELICHCINTEKESKGGISGQPCLWVHLKLKLPHYCFTAMCTAAGVEDVAPAEAWPAEVRRKPEPTADAVRCPPITRLVASPQCAGSRILAGDLPLVETATVSSNACCSHILLPIRSLKEGCGVFLLLQRCSVSSCYAVVLISAYKSSCNTSKSSCCCRWEH